MDQVQIQRDGIVRIETLAVSYNSIYYYSFSIGQKVAVLFRMGNSSRKPEDYTIVRSYRKEEWQQYQCTQTTQLWRHRATDEAVQVFKLYTIPSIQDLDRYEWRASQQDLVKVYHIALDLNEDICSKTQYVRLLIEYVPFRLSNATKLNLEEALTILATAFRAFDVWEQNFKPVQPNEELICFTQWGKPKIWINKNTEVNFADKNDALPLDSRPSQVSYRVRKLFDMVEQKTQNSFLHPYLKSQFRLDNLDYKKGLSIIEQFSGREQLSLKKCIRPQVLHRESIRQELANQIPTVNRLCVRNQSCFIVNQQSNINQSSLNVRGLNKHLSFEDIAMHKSIERQLGLSCSQSQQMLMGGRANVLNPNHQPVVKFTFATFNHKPQAFKTGLSASIPVVTFARSQSSPMLNHSSSQTKSQIVNLNQHKTINEQMVHKYNFIVTPCNKSNVNKIFSKCKPVSAQSAANVNESNSYHPSQNSIIDKVDNQTFKDPEDQAIQPSCQEQQIKNSGTFALIADKQAQDQEVHENPRVAKKVRIEAADNQNAQQMPINFSSFAPDKQKQSEFFSFAPMETNIDTEKSIEENVNAVATCKSVDYNDSGQQTPKMVESGRQLITSQEARLIFSDYNQAYKENAHPRIVQSKEERRFSIEEHNTGDDLQGHCKKEQKVCQMGMQSKLDIIKRYSVVSREQIVREDGHQAVLNNVGSSDLDNYVRQKYDSFINNNENGITRCNQDNKYGASIEKSSKRSVDNNRLNLQQANLPHGHPNKNYVSTIDKVSNTEAVQQDCLDVNFLEKSLDKRYNSQQKTHCNVSQKQRHEDNDGLNIAKLDEELMKFSTSRNSQSKIQKQSQQKAKPKNPPVSRINLKSNQELISESKDQAISAQTGKVSLDCDIKVFNEHKAEMAEGKYLAKQNNNTVFSHHAYQRQGKVNYQRIYEDYKLAYPLSQIPRASNQYRYSKISKDLTNKIQQKYNKYVRNPQEKRSYNAAHLSQARSRQMVRLQQSKLQIYQEDRDTRSVFIPGHMKDEQNAFADPLRDMGKRQVSYSQLRSLLRR